jgi:phospholipase C
MFCSLLASTYPNREYMHAAQSYGLKDNTLPPMTSSQTGFPDTTIFAALTAAGVSNRYFYSDIPASALWGSPGISRSGPVAEYYQRCANGTLPSLSFVDPSFLNEGGGTSGDEHPHGDLRVGQAFMSDVVHAFIASPQFRRGALFIVYDEWGGFYDHVRPPRFPDDRNSRDLAQDFGQTGFRVPGVVVSPYVRGNYVSHSMYTPVSILKMIAYKFGLDPLSKRMAFEPNIARSFDWTSDPRLDPPSLPTPAHIVGVNCPNRAPGPYRAPGGAPPQRPNEHDLGLLLTSGYLDRLGFRYRPATPDRIFREPSRVVQAHRAASQAGS